MFICGCDEVKDSLKAALNTNSQRTQEGKNNANVSVRVCSYIDSKSIIETKNALGTKTKRYEKINFEKMYKSAKHKFKINELNDENGKNVIPIILKINNSYIKNMDMYWDWGIVKIDKEGNRTEIIEQPIFGQFVESYAINDGNRLLYGEILELSKKLLNGKYQAIFYTKGLDPHSTTSTFSPEKVLATWDFEII